MTDEEKNLENEEQSETAENSGDATSAKGKVFTQDELDRMFAERAKQAESALLKKLGFENPSEAESILAKAREREEAEKTELQKAQELAQASERKVAELLEAQKQLTTQNEIVTLSGKLGIVDPDAAYRLLDRSAIKYGEDGKPTNIEALLVDMLKSKPYLVGSGTSAMNPGKTRKFSKDELLKMTPAEINKNWDAIQSYLEGGR